MIIVLAVRKSFLSQLEAFRNSKQVKFSLIVVNAILVTRLGVQVVHFWVNLHSNQVRKLSYKTLLSVRFKSQSRMFKSSNKKAQKLYWNCEELNFV